MEPKVNYTLVGLFVILLGAATLWGISFLRGGERGKEYDRYDVFMTESVSGLSVDAPVKYRGVQVGRVKKIVLNPDNPEEVQVILDIEYGTPVKEDTEAILNTQDKDPRPSSKSTIAITIEIP